MHPILFKLTVSGGQIEVGSYRFFLVLAGIVGLGLAWLAARRRGLPRRQALFLILGAAAAVPIGARLLHVATNYGLYERQPERLISFQATGFALFGGLALAALAGALLCRLLKMDLWRAADSSAPALCVSMALVRVGCFLDGCCRGTPSTLPWAVTFPAGGVDTQVSRLMGMVPGLANKAAPLVKPVPTHPVDLYELVAALVGLAAVVWLLRRKVADGSAFLALALWFSAFRLANHPWRVPALTFAGPAWFYPALYLAAGVISLVLLRRRLSGKPLFNPRPGAELSIAAPD